MDPGQIILIVLIGVAAIAALWVFLAPKKALLPGKDHEALERGKDQESPHWEQPAEDGAKIQEVVPPELAAPSEAPALVEVAVPLDVGPPAPAQTPARAEELPVEVTPAEPVAAKPAEPVAAKPEVEALAPAEAPAPAEPPAEPPTLREIVKPAPIKPPPVFAPPRTREKPSPTVPERRPARPEPPKPEPVRPKPAPIVEPKPAPPEPIATAPVPMPIDKPTIPTREQRELAEIETKKSERDRYRQGLTKTKKGFIARLARLFKGKPKVSDDLKDEIEEVLFTADIGSKTATTLLESVTKELDKKEVADPDAVWAVIRQKALEILDIDAKPLEYEPKLRPYTLLMIGVNGVGKTTTIGKLAARHVEAGRKTLMVAGDTYRAAAGEQLEVWARRVGCDIHMGKDGADPSAVLFDGIMRGRNEGYDVVLCDTAGRLHTRKELMDELGKMGRAASKALSKGRDEMDPHDTFLVLDATIGQNALAQAQMFKETMNFSGLVLTKLDGTAKGGVVLGVVDELRVPIRYIGIGERVEDLRRFDPEAFCDVLFRPDENNADNADD
jgi:fused signal recognition particle receptor